MAEFTFRASGIGAYFECQYKAKLNYELSKDIDSPALRIGTNVHSILIHKLSHGVVPYPSDITPEEEEDLEFLYVPAKFPTMDLSRGSYWAEADHVLNERGKRIAFTIDESFQFITEIPRKDTLPEIVKELQRVHGVSACPVEFKVHRLTRGKGKSAFQETGLNIMSKTRGPDSSVDTNELIGEQHNETSIYEVVDKDMFSRPLVSFEQRTTSTTEVEVMGEKHTVHISGQYDSAGPGIIMDLKTAKSKPDPTQPGTFMKYVVQQAVYAKLNGLKDVKVVLLYLVKTKVPQVVPIVFTYRTENLNAVDDLLKQYIKIVHYYDRKALFRSPGTQCKWCHVRDTCLSDFPLWPTMLDVMEITKHDFEL